MKRHETRSKPIETPVQRPEGDMEGGLEVGSTTAAVGGRDDMNGSQRSSPAPETGTGSVSDQAGRTKDKPASNSGTSSTSIGGPSGASS